MLHVIIATINSTNITLKIMNYGLLRCCKSYSRAPGFWSRGTCVDCIFSPLWYTATFFHVNKIGLNRHLKPVTFELTRKIKKRFATNCLVTRS